MPSTIIDPSQVARGSLGFFGSIVATTAEEVIEDWLTQYVFEKGIKTVQTLSQGFAHQLHHGGSFLAKKACDLFLTEVRSLTQGAVRIICSQDTTSILDLSSLYELISLLETEEDASEEALGSLISKLEKRGCEFWEKLQKILQQPVGHVSERLTLISNTLRDEALAKISLLSDEQRRLFQEKFVEIAQEPFTEISSLLHLRTSLISLHHLGVLRWSSIEVSYLKFEQAFHFVERSSFYQVGKEEKMENIGFINGINTPSVVAHAQAELLSQCAKSSVQGVLFGFNGPIEDIVHVLAGQPHHNEISGVITEAEICLLKLWERFFEKHPTEKFLQVCFSGGSTAVYNALRILPEEWRSRILVLAIAPSTVIPLKLKGGENLCHSVHNYVAAGDFCYMIAAQKEIIENEREWCTVLLPEGNSVHSFASLHFQKVLKAELNHYVSTGSLQPRVS